MAKQYIYLLNIQLDYRIEIYIVLDMGKQRYKACTQMNLNC